MGAPLVAGLLIMSIGLALALIAIPLGGWKCGRGAARQASAGR